MSLPSSQGSALDENELNELQASVQVETTKSQTTWALKTFSEWCEKRHINIDLATVDIIEEALHRVGFAPLQIIRTKNV